MKLIFTPLRNVALKPLALLAAFLRLFVLLSHRSIFPGMCLLTSGFLQYTPLYNLNGFSQNIN